MGRFESKRKKKSGAKIAAMILGILVLAAALVLYVMPQVLYWLSGDAEPLGTEPVVQEEAPFDEALAEAAEEETVPEVDYPVELENGLLVLENLFEFEGINPDSNNEAGNAIASITLKNTSEAFLAEAKLTLMLSDGSAVEFLVTNLPAGKTAMAFALDNTQLDSGAVCVDVSGDAVWDNGTVAIPDEVTVSIDGTTVMITNNTAQEIPALTVYCRDPFGEEYFGGKAYEYAINNLSANGTATVEALDSILGLPEVVRIAIHE